MEGGDANPAENRTYTYPAPKSFIPKYGVSTTVDAGTEALAASAANKAAKDAKDAAEAALKVKADAEKAVLAAGDEADATKKLKDSQP